MICNWLKDGKFPRFSPRQDRARGRQRRTGQEGELDIQLQISCKQILPFEDRWLAVLLLRNCHDDKLARRSGVRILVMRLEAGG